MKKESNQKWERIAKANPDKLVKIQEKEVKTVMNMLKFKRKRLEKNTEQKS